LKVQGFSKNNSVLRATQYILLTIAVVFSLLLLVTGISILVEQTLQTVRPFWLLILAIILAFSIIPLGSYLKNVIKRAYYGQQRVQQQSLAEFEQELIQLIELPDLLAKLREHITLGLNPSSLHLFILDPAGEQYICAPDQTGNRPLTFASLAAVRL